MSSKLTGLLVVGCVWAASPSPARAEDRKAEPVATKQQWVQLATFMSGEYRDAGAIARVRATGGRMLLKRPLPPVLPSRTDQAVKDLGGLNHTELWDTATRIQELVVVLQERIKLIDRRITARRMDEQFMNEVLKDYDKNNFERLKAFFGALEEQDAREKIDKIKKEVRRFDEKVLRPTYLAGKAQRMQVDEEARFEADLQQLWERKLLDKMSAYAGPAFDKPVHEVARTQLAEEIGVGTAVVWRGLCVTNVGSRALTNVTLDLTLTAGADEKLRRTWFFPAMKPRQTFVLYVNDRAFGSAGHTAQADSLLAEVRALCDEGRQEAQTYKLLKDGRGHLGKGTVKLMSAGAMKAEAKAVALFRALAEKEKAVMFSGGRGSDRVELRFAEPTELLLSLGGKPLVQPKQYLRITLTGASTKDPIELDGHPEPAGGKVELLSHLNVNGAVEPVVRSRDRHYGSLTIEDGKLTLRIHKMTYTAPVADTGISLESLPADRSPSGGVLRSRPGSTPAPAKLPSLEGTWAATFKNGSKADFTFTRDRQFTGTNGATGTWSQTDWKVRIVTKTNSAPLVWEGEIDPDGNSLTATTTAGGRVTATRK